MKKIIYKLTLLFSIVGVVLSCSSPEGDTNYTPAEYEFPTDITLESSNISNSSFEFTFNSSGAGKGYYVVVEGGSDAPSNEDVFEASADGLLESGSFELNGSPISVEIVDNLCDGSTYDIYAVQFTSDSFLSPVTHSISVTTNTNASIGGTYNTVANGIISSNFGGGNLTDYTNEVTITDNGDGTFTFSDATNGYYPDPDYYGSFGHGDLPHTFEVPCNEISDTFTTGFYNCCGDYIDFNGTINADGSISVHWESGFGEVMDVIYTRL